MKLTVFQSDDGDCLLLETASRHLMLCDGGRGTAIKGDVGKALGALRDAGRDLDLVYVSHIDDDHIRGVLLLLEAEAEWRGFDVRSQNRDDPGNPPALPRPPRIKGILHNAFREFQSHNADPVAGLLAAREMEKLLSDMAPALHATAVPELVHVGDEMQRIAAGIPQAIQVSKLIAPGALDIPLNKPPGVAAPAKLLYAEKLRRPFKLGSAKFTLLGPTAHDLELVRQGWNNWLRSVAGKQRLKEIRAKVKEQIDDFSEGTLSGSPLSLGSWEGMPSFEDVTVPNLASLMFVVEEQGKRLLLTGDAHHDYILRGLERTGVLQAGGGVHVDALKVQHHGSEHNMNAEFAQRVSADHYVFCGDGTHDNPHLGVLDLICESRLSDDPSVQALAPEAAGRDFTFWFSTNAKAVTAGSRKRAHFERIEAHVARLQRRASGRLRVRFNDGVGVEIEI